MSNPVKYVRPRDGVFQYERRVPLRVQRDAARYASAFSSRPLFRRSLRTKDTAAMFVAAKTVHDEFERLIFDTPFTTTVSENARAQARSVRPGRVVTQPDLDSITGHYAALTAQPFEQLHRRANVDAVAAEELERVEYEIGLDAESILRQLRTRHCSLDPTTVSPVEEATHLVMQHGYRAPQGSEELGAIIGAVRAGMEQGFARMTALMQGTAAASLPTEAARLMPPCPLTLADATQRLLADRPLSAKLRSEISLALRQFEEVVGDKALSAITRDDVHSFASNLATRGVGGKSAGSVARTLSAQTIAKRLRMLSVAVTHVADRGAYKDDNVFANVKASTYVKGVRTAAMPEKRRFQLHELRKIFDYPWFTGCQSPQDTHLPGNVMLNGCEYWVPVVAAFTGCRASELGGLKVNEVRLNHPCPHVIIRNNEYRSTKNGRQRSVPIVDALLKIGFGDYVERIASSGADRLFPDWKARQARTARDNDYPLWSNGKVIRSFNRTVIPTVLGDTLPPDARREVTFHAFRGAFKALLTTTPNMPPNVINEIIGHAKNELDARSIGTLSIEETYPFARSVNYPNLVIPARLNE